MYLRGFDARTPVGVSGLESMLEEEVAGIPGGVLRAGDRVIASSRPRPAPRVKSTFDIGLQRAVDGTLGDRVGGIAVLDAQSAELYALSGLASSAPQPPGSTFKIVTTTAALEARLASLPTRFPVERGATVDGTWIENADGESCGGDLVDSFAHSCNSVFAPLGVRVGAERLVRVAERYGFNGPPPIRGAKASTLPKAAEIGSDLELAATALGQGQVLATPLELASMAQTVASDGLRREPRLLVGAPGPRPRQVTTRPVARALARMMVAVVERGTGRGAALEGITVAGKTGTAELGDTTVEAAEETEADTDAWFVAFAPADRPRLAVAVMLIRQGKGGERAAPIAREVLRAGLR